MYNMVDKTEKIRELFETNPSLSDIMADEYTAPEFKGGNL